ncbi:MAG: Rne/Rng family ribonuclease [Clostridia bacterium]
MKNIIIDVQPNVTFVCVVENDELQDFWVERGTSSKVVGNVYKAKVMNVLKGMQACFVNIGIERNTFLYAGDTLKANGESYHDGEDPEILLKAGDVVLCQVLKDEFGNKGARITMNISLPGRVLVMMPMLGYIGLSRKIENEEKRQYLTDFLEKNKAEGSGYIVRTEAENATEAELLEEIELLNKKWKQIKKDFLEKPVFTQLYQEDDIVLRTVRDMFSSDIDAIITNDESIEARIKTNYPHILEGKPNIIKYNAQENLMQTKDLASQVAKLLKKKVVLSNGAYLIIDRTEALTVIDVNTGKYIGDKNLEETVYETNRIAGIEIARQLRLRNIGGIIVVDFIDMHEEEHQKMLLEVLQQELNKDKIKTNILGMTGLGLVEITRKKTRSMLEAVMLQPCPYCNGDGYVFSDELVLSRIHTALNNLFEFSNSTCVKIYVHPSIFSKVFALKYFKKECANEWKNKRIYIIGDSGLHIEKFEIKEENSAIIDLPDTAKLLY